MQSGEIGKIVLVQINVATGEGVLVGADHSEGTRASEPSVLVRSRGCSRTPPRPHGSVNTNEK